MTTKITPLQVWIIGFVLALIAGLIIFFALIRPANDRFAAAEKKYTENEAIVRTKKQKEDDRKKALQEVAQAEASWRRYDSRLMPNIDLSNLYTAMLQVWNEQIKVLGPKIERYLRSDTKVQVLQANFALPAPPTDPNEVNRKVFVYNMGTVSVMGTFNDVLNHVSRWNNFDRLVLTDNLTLSGNSPRLVGQYTLTAFVFPRNADKPGEAFPVATSGGFRGGAMGMPGGMPGGGMGGYGAMMGSGPPPAVGGPAAGGYGGGFAGPAVGGPAVGGGPSSMDEDR